jgi:hypothetical protein
MSGGFEAGRGGVLVKPWLKRAARTGRDGFTAADKAMGVRGIVYYLRLFWRPAGLPRILVTVLVTECASARVEYAM